MEVYKQALDAVSSEMEDLLEERSKLEERLEEIKDRVERLRKSMAGLSALLGEADAGPALGLTDAVRALLKASRLPLSAVEVRDRLREEGYPVDDYKQPLAVIHTTLRRLEEQDEVRALEKDGKTCYSVRRIKSIRFDN